MQTNQDYINYYEKVVKTESYQKIQLYFKNTECVNPKVVGHMTYLCRQSKAKEFIDWVKYYDTTPFANNFNYAKEKLQERLRDNKLQYDDKTVSICLRTFLLYQTWIGVEQEKAVMKLVADKNFYCLYPQTDIDLYHNIDIILVSRSKKKWVAGIQVKSSSFIEMNEDRNRTVRFHKRYHLPTLTVRYDRYTKEFFEVDIENVQLYKRQLMKYEKSEQ